MDYSTHTRMRKRNPTMTLSANNRAIKPYPPRLAVLHEQDEPHNEQDGDRADQDAIVGHDQRIGDEDAFDDLRHAALFLAEEQENDGVEKEGDRRGQEHRAFFAHAAPDDRA